MSSGTLGDQGEWKGGEKKERESEERRGREERKEEVECIYFPAQCKGEDILQGDGSTPRTFF